MKAYIRENLDVLSEMKDANDEFSPYDCETSEFVIELKARKERWFPTTLIEKAKHDKLTQLAELTGRTALYAVYAGGTIYFFNLNRLKKEGYDYHWQKKNCKTTAEFGNTDYVPKRVGFIAWNQAKVALKVNTEEVPF